PSYPGRPSVRSVLASQSSTRRLCRRRSRGFSRAGRRSERPGAARHLGPRRRHSGAGAHTGGRFGQVVATAVRRSASLPWRGPSYCPDVNYYHVVAMLPGGQTKTVINRPEAEVMTGFIVPFLASGTITTNWGK